MTDFVIIHSIAKLLSQVGYIVYLTHTSNQLSTVSENKGVKSTENRRNVVKRDALILYYVNIYRQQLHYSDNEILDYFNRNRESL